MSRKATNAIREKNALIGTPAQRRKKYRTIVKEMGARNISLADLAEGLGPKEKGFFDMMQQTEMTMDEAVVLQQYAKAIYDKDTKSAEFLRDTAGEKPSMQIDIADDDNGLSRMSLEELKALAANLEKLAKDVE